jgi:hypothetical protein
MVRARDQRRPVRDAAMRMRSPRLSYQATANLPLASWAIAEPITLPDEPGTVRAGPKRPLRQRRTTTWSSMPLRRSWTSHSPRGPSSRS